MYKFFTTIIIGFFACMVSAQVSDNVVTWDFPIRYGTPEWEKLNGYEAQLLAYNMPDEILQKISTAELVKTCLAYPEWDVIHAFDDRRSGLSMMMRYFNGFHELLAREDAAKELIKVYASMDPLAIGADWTPAQIRYHNFHINYAELLLSVDKISEKFDAGDLRVLSDEVVWKYRQKRQRPDVYWPGNLFPTIDLCLNIIDRDGEFSKNDAQLLLFKRYFVADDIEVLDRVVEATNNLRK